MYPNASFAYATQSQAENDHSHTVNLPYVLPKPTPSPHPFRDDASRGGLQSPNTSFPFLVPTGAGGGYATGGTVAPGGCYFTPTAPPITSCIPLHPMARSGGDGVSASTFVPGMDAVTSYPAWPPPQERPYTPYGTAPPRMPPSTAVYTTTVESGRPSEVDNRAWFSAVSSPRSSLGGAELGTAPHAMTTSELWPGLGASGLARSSSLDATDVSLLRQVNQSAAFIHRYLAEGGDVSTEERQHVARMLERVRTMCEQTMQSERDVAAAEAYFHHMAALEQELMRLVQQCVPSTDAQPPPTPQPAAAQSSETTPTSFVTSAACLTRELATYAALLDKLEQLEHTLRALEEQHDAMQRHYLIDSPHTTTTSEFDEGGVDAAAEDAPVRPGLRARRRRVRDRLLEELLLQRRQESDTRATLLLVLIPVTNTTTQLDARTPMTPVMASPTRYAVVEVQGWLGSQVDHVLAQLQPLLRHRETQLDSLTHEVARLGAYDPDYDTALRRREQVVQECHTLQHALGELREMRERVGRLRAATYDALRTQALLRRYLLEALAQRLDDAERHSAGSAPSVRVTATPDTNAVDNTDPTSRPALLRGSELTSNPTTSTRTSTLLPPYELPRASDVFRSMLERIAVRHAVPVESRASSSTSSDAPPAPAPVPAVTPPDELVVNDDVAADEAAAAVILIAEREVSQMPEEEPKEEEEEEAVPAPDEVVTPAPQPDPPQTTVTQTVTETTDVESVTPPSCASDSDGEDAEEYSLRSGTLLRGLGALVRAVVKRAVTFSDEDEDGSEGEEEGRWGHASKRVRRE